MKPQITKHQPQSLKNSGLLPYQNISPPRLNLATLHTLPIVTPPPNPNTPPSTEISQTITRPSAILPPSPAQTPTLSIPPPRESVTQTISSQLIAKLLMNYSSLIATLTPQINELRTTARNLSSTQDSYTKIVTLTQKIDILDGSTLKNITFTGSSNSFSLKDTDIPDDITVTGSIKPSSATVSNTITVEGSATSSYSGGVSTAGVSSSNGLTVSNGSIVAPNVISRLGTTTLTNLTVTNLSTSTFSGGIQTLLLDITSTTATSTFANGIQLSGGCFRTSGGTCLTPTSPGGSDTQIQFNSSGAFGGDSNFIWDNTNKRLGLGTSTPASLLSVHGNSLTSGTSTAGSLIATSTVFVGGTTGSSMVVLQNGNVGIGTTSPSTLFSVAGNSFFGTGPASTLTFNAGTFTYATPATSTISQRANAWSIATSSTITPILSVNGSNGRIGIGTLTPTSTLSVVGSIEYSDFLNPATGLAESTITRTTTTVIDDTLDWGNFTSIMIGKDGNPIVMSYEETNDDIYIVKCGDKACSAGNTSTRIETGDAAEPSATLGTDGNPVIAWRDYSGTNVLKVTRCFDPGCTGTTTVVSADSLSTKNIGENPSIIIGTNGNPIIVHRNSSDDQARVTKCGNPGCTSGNTSTALTGTTNGRVPDIAIGVDGLPIIVSGTNGPGNLDVTRCGNTSCSSGNVTTSTGPASSEPKIIIGLDGLPIIISVKTNTPTTAYFIKCGNLSCSSGNNNVTLSTTDIASYHSVALGLDGNAVILTGADSSAYKTYKCQNPGCTTKTTTTIHSVSPGGSASSIAIGVDGNPVMAYKNASAAALIVARCANPDCSLSSAPGFVSGTDIGNWGGWFKGEYASSLRNISTANLYVSKNIFGYATTTLGNIFASNALGVGTTTPVAKFNIQASVAGGPSNLLEIMNSSGTSLIRVNSSGYLGLGTTTPNWPLQVDGTRPSLAISDSSAGENLKHWLISSMGGSLYIGTSTGVYATSTPAVITMLNGGNIGIGTSSPGARLSITQLTNTDTGGILLAATDNDVRAVYMDTSGIMNFFGGDGVTKNNATLNAAGAWTNGSDLAYKENIQDLSYGLNTLLSLQPRSYTMKGSDMKQVGFIAQELEQFVPEVVEGEEGRKGISYGNLTAVVVKAVQELSQKLDEAILEGTISSVPVSSLEGDLNLNRNQILNVSRILSANGAWSIDENGKLAVKELQAEKIETKQLELGSSTQPSGITIYDRATGEAYCSFVEHGLQKATPGACEE